MKEKLESIILKYKIQLSLIAIFSFTIFLLLSAFVLAFYYQRQQIADKQYLLSQGSQDLSISSYPISIPVSMVDVVKESDSGVTSAPTNEPVNNAGSETNEKDYFLDVYMWTSKLKHFERTLELGRSNAYLDVYTENNLPENIKVCSAKRFDISVNPHVMVSQSEINIHNPDPIANYWTTDKGAFRLDIECNVNGKIISDSITFTFKVGPASICDTKKFAFTVDKSIDAEKLKKSILGSWVGCMSNPWGPGFEVSFEFREDGTYSAKNIEKFRQPESIREGAALYYGEDDDHSAKKYSISEIVTDGYSEGTINIVWSEYFREELGTIRKIGMSENGSMLYLEVFQGRYGPLVYHLERK